MITLGLHSKAMKKYRIWFCVAAALCLTLCSGTAQATGFILPAGVTEIGEEAFQGNTALTHLTVPDGVRSIGSRAFADCSSLNTAVIPYSVSCIGENAFSDCGEALLIQCAPGSAACAYAVLNRVDYRADTVCRALIIGQTYTGTGFALQGPANDLNAVRLCLANLGLTVTARSNLSAAEILQAIGSVFAQASSEDISLFYYSGHGDEDGSLVGKSGAEYISPLELKAALDQIPGRKVIIVDACYSGRLIEEERLAGRTAGAKKSLRNQDDADGALRFISAFQSAFAEMRTRGALNAESFYVITAARENEESMEGYISADGSGRNMGYFSYAFCLGLGFDGLSMRDTALNADANGDGAVSMHEAYQWAYQKALETAQQYDSVQHAVVWPTGCRWFAPFRP